MNNKTRKDSLLPSKTRITDKKQNHTSHIHKAEINLHPQKNSNPVLYSRKKKRTNPEFFMFSNAPAPCLLMDFGGFVLDVNLAAQPLFGYKLNYLKGKCITSFLAFSELHGDFLKYLRFCALNSELNQYECIFIRKKGDTVFVLLQSSVIHIPDYPDPVIFSIITDITEQKLKENIRETILENTVLNDMKEQFLTKVSHEFRTPLTAILTSTEILNKYLSDGEDNKCHRHIEKIKLSVNRLKEVLDDFFCMEVTERGSGNTGKKKNSKTLIHSEITIKKHILTPR